MSDELTFDAYPFIRVYNSGRIERFFDTVPAGDDTITGVESKDVPIAPPLGVRIYKPKTTDSSHKIPLLIYIHGGGFVTESNASAMYHTYLNSLVANADIIAVSVEYRLAPEHSLPAAYEDTWSAIQWVAAHRTGSGPDPWLNQYADFKNVVFAGDSAGGNVAHHMGIRVGFDPIGLELSGIVLVHPYFGAVEPLPNEDVVRKFVADRLWKFVKPDTSGSDDPDFNPNKDPNVSRMGCDRILVCVADKDLLKYRGWQYRDLMRKSGWNGQIEIVEDEGVDHVFHLLHPTHEKASLMMKRFYDFINKA
jgi:acetyl esterase/lipase